MGRSVDDEFCEGITSSCDRAVSQSPARLLPTMNVGNCVASTRRNCRLGWPAAGGAAAVPLWPCTQLVEHHLDDGELCVEKWMDHIATAQ
eukprot:CAMPEP_0115887204 /NCGR_PEP_ID=MMETSP0287-20121206/31639_1 /TAXON_ID=412157 /ORGANISM="Chrysochromulina rotalis, Strain UIO044" /LENGTH=89 /DNA_ID=CAMNT_0003343785 /DNA_START=139 /DNA_END=405 /DNA_ORIENTATION=-